MGNALGLQYEPVTANVFKNFLIIRLKATIINSIVLSKLKSSEWCNIQYKIHHN
jgi:hypothetical protein